MTDERSFSIGIFTTWDGSLPLDESDYLTPPICRHVSLISVCLHIRILESYSKTELSERKTSTTCMSFNSFMARTDTTGGSIAFRYLRTSLNEACHSRQQESICDSRCLTLYTLRPPLIVKRANAIASSLTSMKHTPSTIRPFLIICVVLVLKTCSYPRDVYSR